MWVERINVVPSGKNNVAINVKVVTPDPLKKAQVTLEVKLSKDGTVAADYSGSTNNVGEISFRFRPIDNEGYVMTITELTHGLYLWDQSKSVSSASYPP
jgi:hypothetical protein